jgi:hypothetical protein
MYSWAHRVLGAPYKRTPDLLQKGAQSSEESHKQFSREEKIFRVLV